LSRAGWGRARTNSGRYTIEGLPYGSYKVVAGRGWNWCTGQNSIYAAEYHYEAGSSDEATPIELSEGSDDVHDITFTLEVGGVITGQVHDATTGLPMESIQVYLDEYDNGGLWIQSLADANGVYTITGLLAADYRVRANPPPGYARQYYDHQLFHHLADRVTVTEGSTVTDINFDLQPGGTISGTVYADDSVTPLANVHVDVDQGGFGTCTDENGRYVIDGLPYGDYKVYAGGGWNWCLNQSSIYIREYYPETPDPDLADTFTLDDATPMHAGVDFTLTVGGSITGQVIGDDTGLPLANVKVIASDFYNGHYISEGRTDASGVYTITGLYDGDFCVGAQDPNTIPDGYAIQFYSGVQSCNNATPVPVVSGGLTGGIDFALQPGGVITGRVLDQNSGLPIANVMVDVHADNWGWGTCTDNDGYYAHRAIPYGHYRVSSGGGWNWCQGQPSEHVQEYYAERRFWHEADIVALDGGTTPVPDINLTLEKGGYLAGNVRDDNLQPVPNLRMVAVQGTGDCPWCEQHIADAFTDANGDYLIGPVAPDSYTVLADTNANGQLLVSEYYNDVYQLNSATFVTVTSEATTSGINFVLDPGVWITGHVTVPPGYSNADIPVDAWKTDGIWYGVWRRTDANGDYILPVPPIYDSRWGVSVRPEGPELMYQWAHQFDLAQQSHWDFELGLGSVIAGWVTLDGGVPDYGWVNADGPWMSNGAEIDQNGYYEIHNLPPGEYQVRFDAWPDYMWTYYGGHDWAYATVIHLGEQEIESDVNIEVQRMGQLEGHVYDSDGSTPIEGAHIVARDGVGEWHAWSQVDGYFFMDLPATDVRVLYEPADWPMHMWGYYSGSHTYAQAEVVSVPPLPGSANIEIGFQRRATIGGQVRDADSGEPLGGIHVSALTVDAVEDWENASWACTEADGSYVLEGVSPGEVAIMAVGTCGNDDYGLITSSLTALPGLNYTLDLSVTAGTGLPDIFTIRANGDPFGYTPIRSLHGLGLEVRDHILALLYEPLVDLDDQGSWYSELLVQVPTEANGGAAVVGGYLEVTYQLKTGLKWSDGQPLTSADIRFTWEMLTQPRWLLDEYLVQMGTIWKVEEVLTPDPLTAVFVYERGAIPPAYLGALTYLLPEHLLGGRHPDDIQLLSHYAHYPVSNGPYVVADWVPGSHLELIPNPNYHKSDVGLPYIRGMRVLYNGHPFWSVVNGGADVSLLADPAQVSEDWETFDVDLHPVNARGFATLVPNLHNPLFEDVQVRKALFTALDRRSYSDNYGLTDIVADGYLPPDHPLYSSSHVTYTFDLSQASALLDAAGWTEDSDGDGVREKDGLEFEFNLYFNEGNLSRQDIALTFAQDLASIGVDANVVSLPWEELFSNVFYGELDAYFMGWIFDNRFDPYAYDLYHSRNHPTAYNSYQGSIRNTGWYDPLNDTILTSTTTELDFNALGALYGEHTALYTDQLPEWPIYHYLDYHVASPILLNFRPEGTMAATWNAEYWQLPANPYDLTVRKTLAASSPAPQPGSDIIYAITVRNAGYFSVTGATLVDTLPPDVVYVSANPAPTTISGSTLIWQLGTVPGSSAPQVIEVTVHIPDSVSHGTNLVNLVEVFGDQSDTQPGNNGFSYQVTVRDDVDLAVKKSGIGLPAVGAAFNYYVDYANWGGAPASGAVITDTLPPEVAFIAANPAPDSINNGILAWNLPEMAGNEWGGRIEITTTIMNAGTVVNTADIWFGGVDVNLGNNSAISTEQVNDILSPLITQPTQGVADGTPTIAGFAPAEAVVELWDLSSTLDPGYFAPAAPTLLITTTADISGTFSVELALDEGTYIVTAVAHKDGLTSDYSNTSTFEVNHNLPLDTDSVSITADGATISRGVVRANKYTMPRRLLDVGATLSCAGTLTARLNVTENGLHTYNVPAVSLTNLGGDQWRAAFRLWMAEPHSTYDVWLEWECDGVFSRELLVYILIDPDGYVYDQSLVDAGSPITDSLILDAVVTAYVLVGDEWLVWPADYYGQTNPQVTDTSTPDGVLEAGYYSFLTPPGKYRIAAQAPGYQPYESPVLTVVDTPIHLDIGLEPVAGGSGHTLSPANLAASHKAVDRTTAWLGDVLTYDIWLQNKGDTATGELSLTDAIPDWTTYVDGSLVVDGGAGNYDSMADAILWSGVVGEHDVAHIQYQVLVAGTPGVPVDVVNSAQVSGPAANLASLPTLVAVTTVQNVIDLALEADQARSVEAGQTIYYTHTLTNKGNFTDTFTFSGSSSQGWLVQVPGDLLLGPGGSSIVQVGLIIPGGVASGTVDTLTLTAASLTNSGFTATVSDETTIYTVGYTVYLPAIIK
jgi:peptide/nickel transport system substrate-binding protein